MMVIKRNGQEVPFDLEKIVNAVRLANNTVSEKERMDPVEIQIVAKNSEDECQRKKHVLDVEEISDIVENNIADFSWKVAKNYAIYRYKHMLKRKTNTTDEQILTLLECTNEEVKKENSNKNPTVNSVQRDYMAGEVSKDISKRILLPEDVIKAHEEGIIHFHDMDYFAQHMNNCCLVNLEDMLQNGTVISETMIERPHSFTTACNIAAQAIAQIASCQYGGQSISLAHIAPFVNESRIRIRTEVVEELKENNIKVTEQIVNNITEKRVRKEVKKGIQAIQYQVITLMTTNGQAPFITICMYLNEVKEPGQLKDDLALCIEEMLKQRIEGVKNEVGAWITPAFPKLIYVLEEENVTKDGKYWYLTELAAKCTAKRMVPDYVSEKIMLKEKVDQYGDGCCYPPMGCRSFLTPDRVKKNVAKAKNYKEGVSKYYGRFNQGVVTINLPDIALSSKKDEEAFWNIFENRLELCYKALMCRHERLRGTKSDVAPILWQHGGLARLQKGETIDKLLYGGYSTLSLGYAGLYECVRYMTGYSHTNEVGKEFALRIMKKMNDKCMEWRLKTDIDFSLYGTPLESTTYKFAKCLQKRFGKVEGITERPYITNSYHVPVFEQVDAFEKLSFESEFQTLSPGGAISYIETPDMTDNIEAVLTVIKYIYDHIMYAELNTKSDFCQVCGYDHEILCEKNKKGDLIWRCPNCGNTDLLKLNVARRTCGYIGTQFWNYGRTAEIKDRVLHLGLGQVKNKSIYKKMNNQD